MSKTYGGWAEIEDWSHREFRRQHKRKSKRDWKKEVEEQMSETGTTTVYVVRNFWTPAGEDFELSEDNHATFSEQGAWDVLYSLAEGQGITLGMNDYSFECVNLDRYTQREYYAIITMEVGND